MAILQRSFFNVKPGRRMRIAPKGKKYCADCDRAKPLSQFGRMSSAPDGLSYYCKTCTTKRDQSNRDKSKTYSWKRHYGMSEHAYWDLFEEQGGVCAICKQPETRMQKGTLSLLAVDHDHTTGQVRGLLCSSCNTGIGQLKDDIALLSAAIAYLQR